jgi:phytoene synthase
MSADRETAAVPSGGLVEELRRGDRARFLTALFAPEPSRRHLIALYAFNLELARIRDAVSQPMLGEIRLQWWRDALAEIAAGGPPRGHEVLLGLAEPLRAGVLDEPGLVRLVDARAHDLYDEPPAMLADLVAYAGETGGQLAALAVRLLGVAAGEPGAETAEAVARDVGTAWALTGILRSVGNHADQGRLFLPEGMLAAEGVSRGDVLARKTSGGLVRVAGLVAGEARRLLASARALRPAVPRAARPALLLAPVADRHLNRIAANGNDPFRSAELAPWVAPAVIGLAAMSGRY